MANHRSGSGGEQKKGCLWGLLVFLLPILAVEEVVEFLGILSLGGRKKGEDGKTEEVPAIKLLIALALLFVVLLLSPFGFVFLGSAWLALRSGSGLLGAIKMGLLGDVGLVVFFVVWTIKKRLWDPASRARNRVRLIHEPKPDMEYDELVERARKVLGEDDAWARDLSDDAASQVFRRHLKKKKKKEEEERRRQAAGAQGQQRRETWGQRIRRWKRIADRYRVPPPPRR